MSIINFQHLAPILATCVTTGGIVFQIGKHSEKLESIGFKVEAQEKKDFSNNQKICDIYNTVNLLKNDLSNIKTDINDIKTYIRNKK